MQLTKRKRFTLELNSHSLSYFQLCEKRYELSQIKLLDTAEEYYPFKRGAGVSKVIELWYRAKLKEYSPQRLEKLEEFLFKRMLRTPAFKNTKWKTDDGLHIASNIMGYFNKYRKEPYKILAVEKGFTEILYEDKNVVFVYSGRPDLIVDFGYPYGPGPMDHKTESRENDIVAFNNQFLGYCWALNPPAGSRTYTGMINYIGLQKDFKEGDIHRRAAFTFTQSNIDRWKSDTIEWCYRIMRSRVNKKYLRSWKCDSKYGTCLYYPICTACSAREEKLAIERKFVKLEKAHRSW